MAIPPLPPLRVQEADGSPNLIPVFELVVSNGTLTDLGGGRAALATGGATGTAGASTAETYVVIANTTSLSNERALTAGLGTVIADSGANAAVYLSVNTPFLVTSARAINTTVPLAGGGNLSADRTLTVDTAFLVTSNRTVTAGTGLYGGGNLGANIAINNSAKQVRIPLALLTVQPDSANAFWRAVTLPLLDQAHVGFLDGGLGIATYWGLIPFNLHPDPSWTLYAYHMPNGGAGGNALLNVLASAVTHAETAAYTLLANSAAIATQANTTMTVSAISGGDFDAVVAISNGDFLFVEVRREAQAVGDTVGDQWNLLSLALHCNVL